MKSKWPSICCIYLSFLPGTAKENFRGIPKNDRKIAINKTVLSIRGAEMVREELCRQVREEQ